MPGEWTSGRTSLPPLALFVYPEKQALATKAETRQPCPRRSNNVVPAHYTQCTAGTTRHWPSSSIRVRRASTQSRTSVRVSTEVPGAHCAAALHTASLAPTQHRGVLGNHHASPRIDCRAAVCVQRANRARQQSARASQCECRDCKDGQRNAKPIGKGGAHPSGKGASSSGMRWSAPVPGRPSTRAAHDGGWLLLLLARKQRLEAELDD